MRPLLPLLLVFAAAAQEQPALERLLDAAPSAPPEIAADLLLRAVEQRRVREPEAVLELLERAWDYAGLARLPMPRRPVSGGRALDRFNALSLRARVLALMNPLGPERARARLLALSAPLPPPLDCEAATVWDPAPYYEAVAGLGSLEDRGQAIRQVTHPSQLAPALELVIGFQGSVEDRAMLAVGWAGALQAARGDSVSFDATRELPLRIAVLAEMLRAQGAGAAYLADAWRAYVLAHWNGELCARVASPANTGAWRSRTQAAYNERLRAAAGSSAPPINFDEEIEPARIIGDASPLRSEETRSRQEEWLLFYAGLSRLLPSLGPAASPADIQRAVLQALAQLDEWEQPVEGVAPGEWLFLRISAAQTLLQGAAGETRTAILRWMLRTLRHSDLQRSAPADWLQAWRQVLAAAPPDLIRQEGDSLMDLLLLAREILGWQ